LRSVSLVEDDTVVPSILALAVIALSGWMDKRKYILVLRMRLTEMRYGKLTVLFTILLDRMHKEAVNTHPLPQPSAMQCMTKVDHHKSQTTHPSQARRYRRHDH